jgi:hypothetical protein
MTLPAELTPTTCDIYRPFGSGSPLTSGVLCRFTEQIDEGRAPTQFDVPPTAEVQGSATAPAAGTTLADTGALSAGQYHVIVHAGSDDTAGIGHNLQVQHYNGANVLHTFLIPTPFAGRFEIPRMVLAANDGVRVVTGSVGGTAASLYTADVYVRPAAGIALWWSQYIDVDDSVDIRDNVSRTTGQDALIFADGDEVRIPSGSNNRYVVVFVTELAKGLANQYKRAFLLRHSVDWTNPSNI